jgi:hypothetical protein
MLGRTGADLPAIGRDAHAGRQEPGVIGRTLSLYLAGRPWGRLLLAAWLCSPEIRAALPPDLTGKAPK